MSRQRGLSTCHKNLTELEELDRNSVKAFRILDQVFSRTRRLGLESYLRSARCVYVRVSACAYVCLCVCFKGHDSDTCLELQRGAAL